MQPSVQNQLAYLQPSSDSRIFGIYGARFNVDEYVRVTNVAYKIKVLIRMYQKQLILHRKYRRNVLWPHIKFTNTLVFQTHLSYFSVRQMRGSSHLAQEHVTQFRHETYVGTFRGRKIHCINNFRQHALVIWKEQTKIHQYAQQINVDIFYNIFNSLLNQRHVVFLPSLYPYGCGCICK